MRRTELKIYVTLLLFHLVACQSNSQKNDEDPGNEKIKNAQQWLVKSVEFYFDQEYPEMKEITTPTYYEYKTDATNVGLDEGLSEAQFHSKWRGKFNTDKAGIAEGFLISAQDWDKIRIVKISFLSSSENGYWFNVLLKDNAFNETYNRNILVTSNHLIANVEE